MPEDKENAEEVEMEFTGEEATTPPPEGEEADPIKELERENAELLDRLQRLQAEFDNYRKRMDSRFSEVAKYASETILLKVLDIYDNIERALEVDFSEDPVSARNGIEAIQKQMDKILQAEGIRPIEALGKEFDPYYQHAAHRTSDLEKPDRSVVEVYQKGYMLKEKVLRPAVVCVNRHDGHSETSGDKGEDKADDGE
ncbi:MAG: nucleotide exchange factor GrpE [Candidatus Thorarchaeota archaeon]|nr:MAG: nucleotide exchange factor GrpE [Candidatus Thorarchaeota archaeon]